MSIAALKCPPCRVVVLDRRVPRIVIDHIAVWRKASQIDVEFDRVLRGDVNEVTLSGFQIMLQKIVPVGNRVLIRMHEQVQFSMSEPRILFLDRLQLARGFYGNRPRRASVESCLLLPGHRFQRDGTFRFGHRPGCG